MSYFHQKLEPAYSIPSPARFEEVETIANKHGTPFLQPPPLLPLKFEVDSQKQSQTSSIIATAPTTDHSNSAPNSSQGRSNEEDFVQGIEKWNESTNGMFYVKWLEFEDHANRAKQDAQKRKVSRNEGTVTLACTEEEENHSNKTKPRWRYFRIKRSILSASSLFLRAELEGKSDKPLIVWNVSPNTMERILEYVKHGLVFGPLNEMQNFLRAKYFLKIGAIWPNRYTFRVASIVGLDPRSVLVSHYTPWAKSTGVMKHFFIPEYDAYNREHTNENTSNVLPLDVPNKGARKTRIFQKNKERVIVSEFKQISCKRCAQSYQRKVLKMSPCSSAQMQSQSHTHYVAPPLNPLFSSTVPSSSSGHGNITTGILSNNCLLKLESAESFPSPHLISQHHCMSTIRMSETTEQFYSTGRSNVQADVCTPSTFVTGISPFAMTSLTPPNSHFSKPPKFSHQKNVKNVKNPATSNTPLPMASPAVKFLLPRQQIVVPPNNQNNQPTANMMPPLPFPHFKSCQSAYPPPPLPAPPLFPESTCHPGSSTSFISSVHKIYSHNKSHRPSSSSFNLVNPKELKYNSGPSKMYSCRPRFVPVDPRMHFQREQDKRSQKLYHLNTNPPCRMKFHPPPVHHHDYFLQNNSCSFGSATSFESCSIPVTRPASPTRWLCKWCGLTFASKRMLRYHYIFVHRRKESLRNIYGNSELAERNQEMPGKASRFIPAQSWISPPPPYPFGNSSVVFDSANP